MATGTCADAERATFRVGARRSGQKEGRAGVQRLCANPACSCEVLRKDISPDADGDLVPDRRALEGKEYPHDRM